MKREIRIGSLSEEEKISGKQLDLILNLSRSHLIFGSDLKFTDCIGIHSLTKIEAREIIKGLISRLNNRNFIETELKLEVIA